MQAARTSRNHLNWQIPAFISTLVLAISLVLVVPIVLDAQVSMAARSQSISHTQPDHDRTLVEFEQGDIHFPYVLGSLWGNADTPPTASTDS